MKRPHQPEAVIESRKRPCAGLVPALPSEILQHIFKLAVAGETCCSSESFTRIRLVCRDSYDAVKRAHVAGACCCCFAAIHPRKDIVGMTFANHAHDDEGMSRSRCLAIATERARRFARIYEGEESGEHRASAFDDCLDSTVGEAVRCELPLTQRRMAELGLVLPIWSAWASQRAFEASYINETTACFEQLWEDLRVGDSDSDVHALVQLIYTAKTDGHLQQFRWMFDRVDAKLASPRSLKLFHAKMGFLTSYFDSDQ
ncbi:hypothetical protein QKT49_gp038 [Acanthamoeba castellanii medusavirus]|uniref:Uncharacterized protein n=1 Tax=Acanthamoeba castellanii medusavirus J1 TaxID=3114988 RepID=A0A3T1CWH5_9VIRU|nr:hypothetical protein QKT49_gp038 [Acanthamoeba castellanii medusavirus]BBI30178.1 hypothetical protein [Acanthamoeba castellanii medusavirus J1]